MSKEEYKRQLLKLMARAVVTAETNSVDIDKE